MKHLQLPSIRTVVESIPLETAKLEKILAESQSKVASYLDIRYSDSQDVIFLLGGKGVKAGRFHAQGREVLTVSEALQKLRAEKQGTISFYEISKLLMIVVMGTFMFEPTHSNLKTKVINFHSLLGLFERKRFTGYLELKTNDRLNYLTFFEGQPREGYFSQAVAPEYSEFPVKLIAEMVENSDEHGEINVYQSVGEENLHSDNAEPIGASDKPIEPKMPEEAEKNQFTSEILDLCLVAIYEDLFRTMSALTANHLDPAEQDILFTQCFEQARYKHPIIFKGVDRRDDGTLLHGGVVNFERLLKAKNSLPLQQRDEEFQRGMNELTAFRISAMQKKLSKPMFRQALLEMTNKIASSRKNYQGNFIIIKFLYELSRILEKYQPEGES